MESCSKIDDRFPPMSCLCGVLHGREVTGIFDATGCVLTSGHDGPHEFAQPNGERWLWETDLECDCEHCMRCEGDYCTVCWPKPAAYAAVARTIKINQGNP